MKKLLKIYEIRYIFFALSIILILIGTGTWMFKGLNYGIDFKGGTVASIKIGESYSIDTVRDIVSKYDKQAVAREVQGNEVSINSNNLNNDQIQKIVTDLKAKYKGASLDNTQIIGPSVGKELRQKAIISSVVACIGILIYITFRFEFRSGVAAIIALIHDLLITIGVYAVFQIPVNSSFIAAALTILGYSINDTVVVFDRIRENKKYGKYKELPLLVDASITETIARSINTMLTTLLTISMVYIFGVESIKEFAFPLIVGIVSGGYSSVFIASPLWVIFENMSRKKKLA